MSNAIVSNVYRYVIDDVINQVRDDFEDMGIDDSILQELQRSWESKVARSRVANFGFKDDLIYDDKEQVSGSTSEPYNNGLYATEYSQAQPSAASLATLAANSHHLTAQQNHPQTHQQTHQNHQQSHQQEDLQQNTHHNHSQNYTLFSPQIISNPNSSKPYSTGSSSNNPNAEKDYSNLQLPALPSHNLPQNDGPGDEDLRCEDIDQRIADLITESQQKPVEIMFERPTSDEPLSISSLSADGGLLQYMKEQAIKAGAISPRTRISQLDGGKVDDENDINSDLDDTDDDNDNGVGGEEIEHIILCLYDKVSRTKNKWKCVLKDGIMLVNGRDYLFHRANGDFEW
ncbi:transcription factor IIA, alpha/beta subunit [Pilobolus umbonatus]|nr:transcription factor IIA, alpha/beta subunit [Pilobolus umbonatus]